jgi:hypothetical protein
LETLLLITCLGTSQKLCGVPSFAEELVLLRVNASSATASYYVRSTEYTAVKIRACRMSLTAGHEQNVRCFYVVAAPVMCLGWGSVTRMQKIQSGRIKAAQGDGQQ